MVIAIGVLIALVCLGVAAAPFLKYRRSRQTVDPTEVVAGLEGQRQQIYREMLTLAEGYRAGSIPEPEFNSVSETLRRRAAENLWLQRRWEERLADLDEALEAIISQVGFTAHGQTGDEKEPLEPCPECGARLSVDATTCLQCGTERDSARPVSGGRASN